MSSIEQQIIISPSQFTLLDRIAAFIDIQGFYVNGKFYPRQIAVVQGYYLPDVIDISTGLRHEDLSEQDQRTAEYSTRHVHGLTLDSDSAEAVHISRIDILLKQLESRWLGSKYSDERLFVHNNNHTRELLEDACIPSTDIRSIVPNIPNTRTLISEFRREKRKVHLITASDKAQAHWKLINLIRTYRSVLESSRTTSNVSRLQFNDLFDAWRI